MITVTDLFCGAGGSGLGATAVPGVRLVIAMRIGEAGHQILEYAKGQDMDLVIVGRQGAGAVGKILCGNVTERVVRKAGCPVLVSPPTPK